MWDGFTRSFSHLISFLWFTGVALMIVTIPACMFKIFSALWEPDDVEEEEQAVYDKPRRV